MVQEYVILPKFNWQSESIRAESPEEAIAMFAADMDSDMNQYFVVILKEKVNDYLKQKRYEQHEKHVTEWMKSILLDQYHFGLKDEKLAASLAEIAYDIYSYEDGYTEYEAIEKAYDDYMEECEEEDEVGDE